MKSQLSKERRKGDKTYQTLSPHRLSEGKEEIDKENK